MLQSVGYSVMRDASPSIYIGGALGVTGCQLERTAPPVVVVVPETGNPGTAIAGNRNFRTRLSEPSRVVLPVIL